MSAAETARPPRKSARKASSAAPANLSDEAANGGAGVTNNDEVLHDLNHTNNYRRRYDLLLKYLADGAEPANLQSVAKFLNPGPMATPISASKLKEGLPKRSDFLKDLHTQGLLGGLFESLIAATERASLPGKPSSIDHSDAFFTSALFVMSHIVRIASHPHPPPNISADAKRAAAVFIRLIDAAPNEAAPDNENEILVTGCGLFLELFTTGAIQDEAFDEILGTPLVHHICRSMGQIPGDDDESSIALACVRREWAMGALANMADTEQRAKRMLQKLPGLLQAAAQALHRAEPDGDITILSARGVSGMAQRQRGRADEIRAAALLAANLVEDLDAARAAADVLAPQANECLSAAKYELMKKISLRESEYESTAAAALRVLAGLARLEPRPAVVDSAKQTIRDFTKARLDLRMSDAKSTDLIAALLAALLAFGEYDSLNSDQVTSILRKLKRHLTPAADADTANALLYTAKLVLNGTSPDRDYLMELNKALQDAEVALIIEAAAADLGRNDLLAQAARAVNAAKLQAAPLAAAQALAPPMPPVAAVPEPPAPPAKAAPAPPAPPAAAVGARAPLAPPDPAAAAPAPALPPEAAAPAPSPPPIKQEKHEASSASAPTNPAAAAAHAAPAPPSASEAPLAPAGGAPAPRDRDQAELLPPVPPVAIKIKKEQQAPSLRSPSEPIVIDIDDEEEEGGPALARTGPARSPSPASGAPLPPEATASPFASSSSISVGVAAGPSAASAAAGHGKRPHPSEKDATDIGEAAKRARPSQTSATAGSASSSAAGTAAAAPSSSSSAAVDVGAVRMPEAGSSSGASTRAVDGQRAAVPDLPPLILELGLPIETEPSRHLLTNWTVGELNGHFLEFCRVIFYERSDVEKLGNLQLNGLKLVKMAHKACSQERSMRDLFLTGERFSEAAAEPLGYMTAHLVNDFFNEQLKTGMRSTIVTAAKAELFRKLNDLDV